MKPAIKWNRPTYRTSTNPRTGETTVHELSPIYLSKCGRYKVTGHMMCGARNGSFNVREWRAWKIVEGAEDVRLGTADKLIDAKAWCEWQINPDWESA